MYVFSNLNWLKERSAVHEVAGMERKILKKVYKLGKSVQSQFCMAEATIFAFYLLRVPIWTVSA